MAAVFFLFAAVAARYTAHNLKFDTDTLNLLSTDLPFRQTYDHYKRSFPQNVDSLVVVIDGKTPELTRQATQRLRDRLQAFDPPFDTVYAPGVSEFFENNGLLYLDTDKLAARSDELARVQPFMARLTLDPSLRGLLEMLGRGLEAVAAGDFVDLEPVLKSLTEAVAANLSGARYRMSWQDLIAGNDPAVDTRRQYIVVQPRLDFGQLLPARQAVEGIRSIGRELEREAQQGLRVRITGNLAFNYEEMQSVSHGMGIAMLLALIMVLGILFLALRSLHLVLATLVTLIAGLVLTAGFATLAVGELNLISIAFAVLYIGLGADFAIHLCLRYQELVAARITQDDALRMTAADLGFSLFLCALTTATGFFAFIPTDYAGVSDLGLIAGAGMFISLFVSMTLLPALLSMRPLRNAERRHRRAPSTTAIAIAQFPYRNTRAVLGGALFIGLLSVLTLPFAGFDLNPLDMRDPQSESVSTFRDLLENSATPPWSLTVLRADSRSAIELKKQLAGLDSVARVMSVDDFIPDDQEEKLAIIDDISMIMGPDILDSLTGSAAMTSPPDIDEQQAALADFAAVMRTYEATAKVPWRVQVARLLASVQELQAQLDHADPARAKQRLTSLEHGLLGYLPDSLRLLSASLKADAVTMNSLPPALLERWLSASGEYRVAVYPRDDIEDNQAMRRFVSEVRSVAPEATDAPVYFVESAKVVVRAFQTAFAAALVVISLLLIVIRRSVREALFVLLPLLLGGLLTTAVLFASGTVFNYANIITLPLLLGIGVDNGIHMIHSARSRQRASTNLLQTSTARGIFFSALTTIASFVNLAYSSHPGTASMGQVLTIGVLCAMLTTLVVLPALVSRFGDAVPAPH